MRKFKCEKCREIIDFGVEIKGAGRIADAIKQHERSCEPVETIIKPIAVVRLKNNNSHVLKLKGTIFDPKQSLEAIKDSVGNLSVILKELDDEQGCNQVTALADVVNDVEMSMRRKYIW